MEIFTISPNIFKKAFLINNFLKLEANCWVIALDVNTYNTFVTPYS